ncbi:MAG: hypothetical protein UZ21_OP11001000009, partial [Microgenomates bacterium OLB22]
KIVLSGEANEVADHYLASTMYSKSTSTSIETQNFTVHSVNIYSLKGHSVIKTFDPVTITVRFTPKVPIADPGVYAAILTPDGQRLTALDFKDFSTIDSIEQGAMVEMGFKIAELALLPGSYYMEIFIKDMAHHVFEQVQKSFPFEVVESPVYGGRHIDRWYGNFGLHAEPYSRIISQDDDNWQTS